MGWSIGGGRTPSPQWMDQKCSQSQGQDTRAPVDAEAIGVCVCPCCKAAEAQGVALMSITPAAALRNPEKPQIGPVLGECDSWLWRGDGHSAQLLHITSLCPLPRFSVSHLCCSCCSNTSVFSTLLSPVSSSTGCSRSGIPGLWLCSMTLPSRMRGHRGWRSVCCLGLVLRPQGRDRVPSCPCSPGCLLLPDFKARNIS